MKTFLLILILSFSVFGQKTVDGLKTQLKSFKDTNDRRYQIKYDKFEDKTTVFYQSETISGFKPAMAGISIQLYSGFTFSGNKLETSVNDFYLIFRSTGKDWQFLRNQRLYAIADGERFDLGEGERDSDIRKGFFSPGFQTVEAVGFKISRDELEKISSAKKVEIKLGSHELEIKDKVKKGLTNILALGKI